MAKKITLYAPSNKQPADRREWQAAERAGYDHLDLVNFIREYNRLYHADKKGGGLGMYYLELANSGQLTRGSFTSWRWGSMWSQVWHLTPQSVEIDNLFLAEFDSRPDLQDIYSRAFQSYRAPRWLRLRNGKTVDIEAGEHVHLRNRPDGHKMFAYVTRSVKTEIVLAKPCPYPAGSLVQLKASAIDGDVDPLAVRRWSKEWRDGARTPGKEVPRIGTILAVSDRVRELNRPVNGGRLIQVLWMGSDRMVDVEEKHIKFYERPTYKNGLKTRPVDKTDGDE